MESTSRNAVEESGSVMSRLGDIVKAKSDNNRPKVFARISDVELACRFINKNRSPDAARLVKEIFNEGFKQFPDNACLNLIFSRYITVYFNKGASLENPFIRTDGRCCDMASEYLGHAKRLKPSLITRFFISSQERLLEQQMEAKALNKSDMNISTYFEYQSLLRGARALTEIRSFYNHLKHGVNRKYDPSTYPVFLERIAVAEGVASKAFENLISQYPRSLVLCQMYARFVLTVKYEPDLAKKLLDAIQDLETDSDSRHKDGSAAVDNKNVYGPTQRVGLLNNEEQSPSSPILPVDSANPSEDGINMMKSPPPTLPRIDTSVGMPKLTRRPSIIKIPNSPLRRGLSNYQIKNLAQIDDGIDATSIVKDEPQRIFSQPNLDTGSFKSEGMLPTNQPSTDGDTQLATLSNVKSVRENAEAIIAMETRNVASRNEGGAGAAGVVREGSLRESKLTRKPSITFPTAILKKGQSFSLSQVSSTRDKDQAKDGKTLVENDSASNEATKSPPPPRLSRAYSERQAPIAEGREVGQATPTSNDNEMQSIELGGRKLGSEASTGDKVYRQRLIKKRHMGHIIKSPLRKFAKYQLAAWGFFVLLTTAGFGIALWTFQAIKMYNAEFSLSTVVQRRVLELGLHIRMLDVYSRLGESAAYEGERRELSNLIQIMRKDVLPHLKEQLYKQMMKLPVQVRLHPGRSPRLVDVTLFDSVLKMVDLAEFITNGEWIHSAYKTTSIDLSFSDNFADVVEIIKPEETMNGTKRERGYYNQFIMDNALDVTEFVEQFGEDVKGKYHHRGSTDLAMFLSLLALLVFIPIIWGFVLLWSTMKTSYQNEIRFLKPFSLISHKELASMVTDLEEYIENINEEMEDVGEAAHELAEVTNSLRFSKRRAYNNSEVLKYAIGLTSMTVLASVIFALPVWRRMAIVDIISAINLAGDQSLYAQGAILMQTDILMNEGTVTERFKAEMQLSRFLDLWDGIHGTFESASLMSLESVARLTSGAGLCKQEDPNGCDPPYRYPPYRTDFGYTETLVRQPLISLVSHFIFEARIFLEMHAANQTYFPTSDLSGFLNDRRWVLCFGILQDIVEGLAKVQNAWCESIISGNDVSIHVISAFFAATVVVSCASYLFIFRGFINRKIQQADTALNLLFIIPETVLDAKPEIKSFIDTFGLKTDNSNQA
ncbi:hypothetical protein HK102_010982 [Quaeritorhiza haematococci]|nr:hypothetical protein HK102_010982 [Quaeritorhiza haematococci]